MIHPVAARSLRIPDTDTAPAQANRRARQEDIDKFTTGAILGFYQLTRTEHEELTSPSPGSKDFAYDKDGDAQ
jgi:hypothetical protein